jgi:hypothetical protein
VWTTSSFGKSRARLLSLPPPPPPPPPIDRSIARSLARPRSHPPSSFLPKLPAQHNASRPGIIVLINDCDWELCGGLDSALQDGDRVVFISTLHGG